MVTAIVCALAAATACTGAADQVSERAAAHAQDLAAIERLRQQDIAATIAGDVEAIGETWIDDVVLLSAGQEAQVGKQAILALRRKVGGPGFRVTSYVPEVKDTTITADGWAFQWGVLTASYVLPGGEEKRVRMNLLHVLKKQADGSWKAAVGMTNAAP